MAYLIPDDAYYQGLFPQYGFGFFAAGNYVRFYRYSLYWLVHQIGLDNVAAEIPKDGEPLLYGQISMEQLDRLAVEGRIVGLKRHFWGVSWAYKNQRITSPGHNFSDYTEWHNNIFRGAKYFLYGTLDHSDKTDSMVWSA